MENQENINELIKLFGINKSALIKAGITFQEFLYLLICHADVNLDNVKASLIAKDFGQVSLFANTLQLNDSGRKAIINVLRSKKEIFTNIKTTEELEKLARRMMEEYPTGAKKNSSGNTYSWRSTVTDIMRRLKKWYDKYPNNYTDDEIVEATKYYVQSFNGNYSMMKVLMYFIMKNESINGETIERSILNETIELIRDGGTAVTDTDWTGELR